jgi:uncharacterized membrane protein
MNQADRFHELQNMLKTVEEFISNVKSVEGIDFELAQKIVFSLFLKVNSNEKIQFYIEVLVLLRNRHGMNKVALAKDIKLFISSMDKSILDDSKKFNMFVMMSLLKKQLLNLRDFDEVFAELLERYPSLIVLQCLVRTLRACIFEEKMLQPNCFQLCLDRLNLINSQDPEIKAFLEDIKNFSTNSLNNQISRSRQTQPDYDLQNYLIAVRNIFGEPNTEFYDQVVQEFEKWLSLTSEQQITQFIKNLENSPLLKGEENLQKFYVFVTDICITNALCSQ